MLKTIIKRSGEQVPFDASKIRGAIFKANVRNATEKMSDRQLDQLTQEVADELEKRGGVPSVEQIQDVVEEKLIAADYAKTAKAYILYRAEHQKLREMDDELVKIYSALTFVAAEDVDLKRENANINADTAAAKLAVALGAKKLVLLTDVRGLLMDPSDEGTLIHQVHMSQIPGLVKDGIISGGMIPKLDCAVEAVRSGVKSTVILDGRIPHSILIELLSDEGIGTRFYEVRGRVRGRTGQVANSA